MVAGLHFDVVSSLGQLQNHCCEVLQGKLFCMALTFQHCSVVQLGWIGTGAISIKSPSGLSAVLPVVLASALS